MAEKKKKKINWLYVIIPVLAVIILASMLGRLFGPSTVDTSEGLKILEGNTVERVVVNDSTQQINLTLSEPYTHKAVDEMDRERNLGTQISFTYVRAQADDILSTVKDLEPTKGWNAYYPAAQRLDDDAAALLAGPADFRSDLVLRITHDGHTHDGQFRPVPRARNQPGTP